MTLPSLTGYGWNAAAHRYYDLETGVFVSNAAVRDGLEAVMDLSALRMNEVTQRLRDETISLAEWQTSMMQYIKESHVAAGALANGGWAQMNPSDWGAVGQLIREQYDYLRNFAGQIVDGTQPLDGRVLVRADMYADAANTTYSDIRTRSYIAQGYDMERRILEDKQGACDDCIDYADESWQPIGTLPEPGQDSVCMTRCRCEKEFSRSTDLESEEA